jgi:transcriptional regulator with XRE-family HTH domain
MAVTLRAQWLGQQLREMREAAGLTLKDIGEHVNRNASSLSRLEAGLTLPRVPDVLTYLDICGIDDPRRREDLKVMARDLWQTGWWDGFSADVSGSLIDWVWVESRAVGIKSFQVSVIPGLLQTRDYAEALIRADQPDASAEQIGRYVELRMARQHHLLGEEPITLSTVIDEGALHRRVGGPAVMREQLRHLIGLADRPHIEILVLPAAAGAHASPDGAFDVYTMTPPYAETAFICTVAGNVVVEGQKTIDLSWRYDRIRRAALSSTASIDALTEMASRLE